MMAGAGIVVNTVDPFQINDMLQDLRAGKGAFAFKGVQDDALQQIAQRDVEVFGQRF